MTTDAHCPECHGDDRPIVHVRGGAVKRRCRDCGHTAWTAIDAAPEPIVRNGYVYRNAI